MGYKVYTKDKVFGNRYAQWSGKEHETKAEALKEKAEAIKLHNKSMKYKGGRKFYGKDMPKIEIRKVSSSKLRVQRREMKPIWMELR